jgi:hypothetical protein
VAGASVEHVYGGYPDRTPPTGFALTRDDGSYVLCGYNDDHGQLVRVRKPGYRTAIQEIRASWVVDVELVPE